MQTFTLLWIVYLIAMSIQTHEIDDNAEMKTLAERTQNRICEHGEVLAVWLFANSVEIHVCAESSGVWASDIPDGHSITEARVSNGKLVVKIK